MTDRTPVDVKDHVDAVVDALVTALPGAIGVGVSYGGDDDYVTYEPPYAVVHLLPGGGMSGPISDSQVDIELRIQVNSVGITAASALNTDKLVTQAMLKSKIEAEGITGRSVMDLAKETASEGVTRDDDIAPPLFYAYGIWRLMTTPS